MFIYQKLYFNNLSKIVYSLNSESISYVAESFFRKEYLFNFIKGKSKKPIKRTFFSTKNDSGDKESGNNLTPIVSLTPK